MAFFTALPKAFIGLLTSPLTFIPAIICIIIDAVYHGMYPFYPGWINFNNLYVP